MFQTSALYVSLAVFTLGMAYKITIWFRRSIDTGAQRIPTRARVTAAARGIPLTLFSSKVLILMKVFILDVLFQWRLLRQDFFRWFIHMCIFGGFSMLFLMHAMEKLITSVLFPSYYPTLNPFLFLRNIFGALVILGVVLAVYRRFVRGGPRPITNGMDVFAIVILAVIMGTGVLLEGAKIASRSLYQEMVDEYAGPQDDETLNSLEAYWVEEYGLASRRLKGPFDSKTLEEGKAFHRTSCAECHSDPKWAFMGYSAAKAINPLAAMADRVNLRAVLLHLHFLSCFLGLAYLPFSKMFHMFAAPVSLMLNAVMEEGKSDPANVATRQMVELDACTHCGACTSRCSVAVAFHEIPNVNILPSEKIASLKALASGNGLSDRELSTIQDGLHLCTNCYRCTSICPVGINLQELWINARKALFVKSLPEFVLLSPLSIYHRLTCQLDGRRTEGNPLDKAREAIAAKFDSLGFQDRLVPLEPGEKPFAGKLNGAIQSKTLSNCYRCMTCSSSCPVVRNYHNPMERLGLMPHQVMHAVGLGLWDLVFSSRMLWDCLGCYQCQQNCPMGVNVTDIMYELKALAISRATANPS